MAESSRDADQSLRILTIGGSLVGLSATISLAHRGALVTVLERTAAGGYRGGGGLGVDPVQLREVTGLRGAPPVCRGMDRSTTAWALLADWLEDRARALPGVEIRRGEDVIEVGDGWAATDQGVRYEADVVLGADGSRSTTRRWVAPDRPDGKYAGVLLWRAMVDESDLPAGTALPRAREVSREFYSGPYRLVTYPVPGADGSAARGRRRLNVVWYDPERTELLVETGRVRDGVVHGSLTPEDLDDPLRRELRELAARHWPSPWREVFEVALDGDGMFATPLTQYRPVRMARGRVALLGDAAHTTSPMMGGGFRRGLEDVAALADVLDVGAPRAILSRYERIRLALSKAEVDESIAATKHYLRDANRHRRSA